VCRELALDSAQRSQNRHGCHLALAPAQLPPSQWAAERALHRRLNGRGASARIAASVSSGREPISSADSRSPRDATSSVSTAKPLSIRAET
jgi:hypothetical protein